MKNENFENFLSFLSNNPSKMLEFENLRKKYPQKELIDKNLDKFLSEDLIPFAKANGFHITANDYKRNLNKTIAKDRNKKIAKELSRALKVSALFGISSLTALSFPGVNQISSAAPRQLEVSDITGFAQDRRGKFVGPIVVTNCFSFGIPIYDGYTGEIRGTVEPGQTVDIIQWDFRTQKAWIKNNSGWFIPGKFVASFSGGTKRGEITKARIRDGAAVYMQEKYSEPFVKEADLKTHPDWRFNSSQPVEILGAIPGYFTIKGLDNSHVRFVKETDVTIDDQRSAPAQVPPRPPAPVPPPEYGGQAPQQYPPAYRGSAFPPAPAFGRTPPSFTPAFAPGFGDSSCHLEASDIAGVSPNEKGNFSLKNQPITVKNFFSFGIPIYKEDTGKVCDKVQPNQTVQIDWWDFHTQKAWIKGKSGCFIPGKFVASLINNNGREVIKARIKSGATVYHQLEYTKPFVKEADLTTHPDWRFNSSQLVEILGAIPGYFTIKGPDDSRVRFVAAIDVTIDDQRSAPAQAPPPAPAPSPGYYGPPPPGYAPPPQQYHDFRG
ncbi:MAG: hypothetical protein LBF33_02660 [Oscillospiraceae bacterium]|jgi:hypothetical protein|nr:hypothetical protein [Oscillospiraceae bacterium]